MRAVIVLLALVAAPICASVSQNRTGPVRAAPADRDAVRYSNGRGGDLDDRDHDVQDDDDEKCDNEAQRAARHGSPRSFEVRQEGRHQKHARHQHAGRKHDQDDEDCVGDPPPPPPPPPTGAEIHGTVFLDANADGLRDATELGIPNWSVMLDGTAVPAVQTDGNGDYAFTGLASGTYTVCEGQRFAYFQTAPQTGTACGSGVGYTIVVTGSEVRAGVDFGNFN